MIAPSDAPTGQGRLGDGWRARRHKRAPSSACTAATVSPRSVAPLAIGQPSTWLGLRAPKMTLVTPGTASTHAVASSLRDIPWRAAMSARAEAERDVCPAAISHEVGVVSAPIRRGKRDEPVEGHASAEKPVVQCPERKDRDIVCQAPRHHVGSALWMEHVEMELNALHRGDGSGCLELAGLVIANSCGPCPALVYKILHGGPYIFDQRPVGGGQCTWYRSK